MQFQKQKVQIYRILEIVKRLYRLEELQSSKVALEYKVSAKTIQRDLKKITKIISLHNRRGVYSLDTKKLSHSKESFQFNLLLAFASNADILLGYFDKENLNQEKIAFAIEFNHLSKHIGEVMMRSIESGSKCEFTYKKPNSSSIRVVSPIKLYNVKERWYLIAKDDKDNKVKTFYFGKIFDLILLENTPHTLTQKDIKEANKKMSIWSDSSKKEELVRIYVKPKIAEYILDGKLHKSQVIHEEHYDGGLEVHYMITHRLEILPRIMSYFPHIYILEPKWLRDELMDDIEEYMRNCREMDI